MITKQDILDTIEKHKTSNLISSRVLETKMTGKAKEWDVTLVFNGKYKHNKEINKVITENETLTYFVRILKSELKFVMED
jgi:hypothetical protein